MTMSIVTGRRPASLRRVRVPPIEALRRRVLDEVYRRGLLTAAGYVTEFPKSGGSWIRAMAQDLVSYSPPSPGGASRIVVHGHRRYQPTHRPAIYVVRDGRDVVVSLYFHHLRHLKARTYWCRRLDEYFQAILGPRYDIDAVTRNLPAFITSLETYPFGGLLRARDGDNFLPWPAHVEEWVTKRDVLTVRYEDMLAQPEDELRRIASHLSVEVSGSVEHAIIGSNSFEAQTRRRPGVEDRTSFRRKGVAGDWKLWFDQAANLAFDHFAGSALSSLGYESDRAWVSGRIGMTDLDRHAYRSR